MLARYGGSLVLNRSWVVSLLRRMGFVKRKATTQAKHQVTPYQFREIQQTFLKQISVMVQVHCIPRESVINWNQTPISVAPTTLWSMAEKGSKRIEVAALNDKRQVTATLPVTMSGMYLPVQILYQGKQKDVIPL